MSSFSTKISSLSGDEKNPHLFLKMRIVQNVLFGHLLQEWILIAYAKRAFPQYNKMEALIESFGDRRSIIDR